MVASRRGFDRHRQHSALIFIRLDLCHFWTWQPKKSPLAFVIASDAHDGNEVTVHPSTSYVPSTKLGFLELYPYRDPVITCPGISTQKLAVGSRYVFLQGSISSADFASLAVASSTTARTSYQSRFAEKAGRNSGANVEVQAIVLVSKQ